MPDPPPDLRDRAAAELCRLYLAKALVLPAGLPGIQFHEITEDGRDVYRELADAVAEVLAEQVGCEHLDGPYRKVLAERDVLRARVDLLTAALTDALEGMQDMRPYVRDRFAEKWHHDEYIERARAVLFADNAEN